MGLWRPQVKQQYAAILLGMTTTSTAIPRCLNPHSSLHSTKCVQKNEIACKIPEGGRAKSSHRRGQMPLAPLQP